MVEGTVVKLEPVQNASGLKSGTWHQDAGNTMICFDLPKGQSTVQI
jgi:hypothetical protein